MFEPSVEKVKERGRPSITTNSLTLNITLLNCVSMFCWTSNPPSIMPLLLWVYPTFGVYLAWTLFITYWYSPEIGNHYQNNVLVTLCVKIIVATTLLCINSKLDLLFIAQLVSYLVVGHHRIIVKLPIWIIGPTQSRNSPSFEAYLMLWRLGILEGFIKCVGNLVRSGWNIGNQLTQWLILCIWSKVISWTGLMIELIIWW